MKMTDSENILNHILAICCKRKVCPAKQMRIYSFCLPQQRIAKKLQADCPCFKAELHKQQMRSYSFCLPQQRITKKLWADCPCFKSELHKHQKHVSGSQLLFFADKQDLRFFMDKGLGSLSQSSSLKYCNLLLLDDC